MKAKNWVPAADRQSVSFRLREAIEADGRTCYALGHEAEVDPGMVQRFLNGDRGLSLATVDRLALALGLRLVEVSRGRGRPSKPARQPPRPADLGHLADGPDERNVKVQAEPDGPEPCELADERLLTNADIRPEPEPVADLRKPEPEGDVENLTKPVIEPGPRNPLLAALGAGRAT
jgi:hypothetical protein